MRRRDSTPVSVGSLIIGGKEPIRVQSMTKVDTRRVDASLAEIEALVGRGCELVRLAVVDREAVKALARIRRAVTVPLAADIHFDYRLALAAIDAGVDKLRINPGNIGSPERVREVAQSAAAAGIAVRVGVNAGSLPADVLVRHGGPTGAAMAEAAMAQVALLEDVGVQKIIVSCKAYDPEVTLEAHRLLAERTSWPFHIGITEAGPPPAGIVRSAVGIGWLLLFGYGDTVRVSLTGPAIEEVDVAYDILAACGVRRRGIELVSCPTCGRCEVDLRAAVDEVARVTSHIKSSIRVAVMGCMVNGPGEARHADVGIAAGRGSAAVFSRGQVLRTVSESEMVSALMEEITRWLANEDRNGQR